MADLTITRSSTLPDSADKTDFYNLVDTATATITNLVNADIASGAAIADSKLAQITTASKVSGAALTSLTSVPAGAGKIPVANIDTGTTANKIVKLDGSAKMPAVDGSALTGLGFGTKVDKSSSGAIGASPTAEQATTDGFISCRVTSGSSPSAGRAIGYTDSATNPTSIEGTASTLVNTGAISESAYSNVNSFLMPVTKNHYWKIITSNGGNTPTYTVTWIPSGA